ncbi:hypothetical protein Bbelb_048730 [Branchiostoma belcheri]|nr:hypothetical protein Bbelb_048730 [Branchiostoma belcheri]
MDYFGLVKLFSPLAASTTPGTPSPDVEAMLEELQELRRFRRCIINDVMPKLPADLQTLVRDHLPPGVDWEEETTSPSPGQRTVPTPPAVYVGLPSATDQQQPAARQQHLPAAELDQPAAAHQHQRAAVLDDPPAAALDHQPVAVRGPGDQTPPKDDSWEDITCQPADLQTLVREHLPPGLEEEGMELEEETMSPGQRTVPTPPAVSVGPPSATSPADQQQPAARQQHLPAAELDQPAAAHQHQLITEGIQFCFQSVFIGCILSPFGRRVQLEQNENAETVSERRVQLEQKEKRATETWTRPRRRSKRDGFQISNPNDATLNTLEGQIADMAAPLFAEIELVTRPGAPMTDCLDWLI